MYIYIYICTYSCICIYSYIYTYIYIYIHLSLYLSLSLYIYIHISLYVYVCIYISSFICLITDLLYHRQVPAFGKLAFAETRWVTHTYLSLRGYYHLGASANIRAELASGLR